MIHHEPWFTPTASSREGRDALERLKRGDTSALRDLWVLGKRGSLTNLDPDFLVLAMADRHGGKTLDWIQHVSRELYPPLEWVGDQPVVIQGEAPRVANAFRVMRRLSEISFAFHNPHTFVVGRLPDGRIDPREFVAPTLAWEHADGTLTDFDREWEDFIKLNPQFAHLNPKVSVP